MSKTNAEYQLTYLEKLKADPERYALYLEKARTKAREKYHKDIQETRAKDREYYLKNSDRIKPLKAISTKKWANKNPIITKFKQYQKSAKKRGLVFDLEYDVFTNLLEKKCSYCNKENANGIDRKLNEIGYTIDNSTPCCSVCNYMKGSLTIDDFINQCELIVKTKR